MARIITRGPCRPTNALRCVASRDATQSWRRPAALFDPNAPRLGHRPDHRPRRLRRLARAYRPPSAADPAASRALDGGDEPLRCAHRVRDRPHLRRHRRRRRPRRDGRRRDPRRGGQAHPRARARRGPRRLRRRPAAQDARAPRRLRSLPRARMGARYGARRPPRRLHPARARVARRPGALLDAARGARRLGLGELAARGARSLRRGARQGARGQRAARPRGRLHAVDAPRAVEGHARADARDGRRPDGRPAVHRRRRERRRVVARVAVPAAHRARRPARRLLVRGAGLGLARLRLAGHGGRRARLDPRAGAARGAPLRPLPARSRRRVLPAMGEAQGRARPRPLRSGGQRSAARARQARARGDARRADRAGRGRSAAGHRRGPRRRAPVRARGAAGARHAGVPRAAVGEGAGRAVPRRGELPRQHRGVLEHARHAPDRRLVGHAARRRSRAARERRRGLPVHGRRRAHARAAAPRVRVVVGSGARAHPGAPRHARPHQHAGHRRPRELDLAPAPTRRGSRAGSAARRPVRRGPTPRERLGSLGSPAAMSERTIGPGAPDPLGATWDGRGVNFALFSQNATHVELCLFDAAGREARIGAARRTGHVWHVYVWDARPGQRYGWRVHGPYAPREGHRFNPNKLLVDPYARALDGGVDWTGPVYAYPRDRGLDDLSFDDRDDAFAKPKSVVVDGSFDWGDDAPPRTPWDEAVLYELHVKGFTKLHPLVPEGERGTFAGLASDAAIGHLTSLGVTTLELLPVHEHLDEPSVVRRGMTNYWGYSTLAFFAPDRRFATRGGDAVREFKQMVKRLHVAGIEVVLDVVYNHTCEGDELGPTVSWRGIDNLAYYRVSGEDGRHYVDYSGCGNTLDAQQPQVIKLITDSLRYWVTEMHVDGFRFDLAPALARVNGGQFDRLAAFLSVVHQDPVLSRVKLVAEPWDLGSGGYQVGNFPVLWTEWNGRYRDTARAFWRGDPNVVADLGYRLTGSSDLFADDG